MHAENVDLNLLYALRSLLAEKHVTRAAARMELTQPAMSHALARLRAQLADPILVRARGGLQLTPRAAALVEPLERVLHRRPSSVCSPRSKDFDPATSTRRFRIAASDYVEIVLWPMLLERIGREAPHVDIMLLRHDGYGVSASKTAAPISCSFRRWRSSAAARRSSRSASSVREVRLLRAP